MKTTLDNQSYSARRNHVWSGHLKNGTGNTFWYSCTYYLRVSLNHNKRTEDFVASAMQSVLCIPTRDWSWHCWEPSETMHVRTAFALETSDLCTIWRWVTLSEIWQVPQKPTYVSTAITALTFSWEETLAPLTQSKPHRREAQFTILAPCDCGLSSVDCQRRNISDEVITCWEARPLADGRYNDMNRLSFLFVTLVAPRSGCGLWPISRWNELGRTFENWICLSHIDYVEQPIKEMEALASLVDDLQARSEDRKRRDDRIGLMRLDWIDIPSFKVVQNLLVWLFILLLTSGKAVR